MPTCLFAYTHGAGQHTDVQRDIFIPVSNAPADSPARERHGWHTGVSLTDTATLEGGVEMKVPNDFVSFVAAYFVFVTTGTGLSGDVAYYIFANYCAVDEVDVIHDESTPLDTIAVESGICYELLIPATMLTNLAKGDYLGIVLRRAGLNPNDTFNTGLVILLGLRFVYIAEQ